MVKGHTKHQNFRLRRAISTEITTKCIVLSHLNPPEGRIFFLEGGVFLKKIKTRKNTGSVLPSSVAVVPVGLAPGDRIRGLLGHVKVRLDGNWNPFTGWPEMLDLPVT